MCHLSWMLLISVTLSFSWCPVLMGALWLQTVVRIYEVIIFHLVARPALIHSFCFKWDGQKAEMVSEMRWRLSRFDCGDCRLSWPFRESARLTDCSTHLARIDGVIVIAQTASCSQIARLRWRPVVWKRDVVIHGCFNQQKHVLPHSLKRS